MTTPDSQQRLKDEAKALRARIQKIVGDAGRKEAIVRATCIYAGLITETLLDYDEPDAVMEQAFHRIADLLRTDPVDSIAEMDILPLAWDIDHDTELGRQLGAHVADRLPRGVDDVHEIAIALVIDDFTAWEKEDGWQRDVLLRLLVEAVIASLSYEMATQDFCDLLIEDYIADGFGTAEAILGLSAVAGWYLAAADRTMALPDDAAERLTHVMVRESIVHGTPGTRKWGSLAAANDEAPPQFSEYMEKLRPDLDEFFDLVGLEDVLGRAVAAAKAAGRMVAVISVEDVGQIHPSIAKSLAKTGMTLGSRHRAEIRN